MTAVESPAPSNESARLQALYQCGILDTEAEQAFDDLVMLAADICQVPIALVSLVDDSRQWFKARLGLDVCETPRPNSFCAHTICGTDLFVVPDALQDERFRDNVLVTEPPHIRFYAGMPLILEGKYAIGTLCVIDQQPRQLTPRQLQSLEALGRQVVNQIELRLHVHDLDLIASKQTARKQLYRQVAKRFQRMSEKMPVGIFESDEQGNIQYANTAWREIVQPSDQTSHLNWLELIAPDDREGVQRGFLRAMKTGKTFSLTHRVLTNHLEPRWVEIVGAPVLDSETPHFLATLHDVSAKIQSQQELVRARDAAEAAARSKSEFLANMSHEIRTPMTAILGYTDILADEAELSESSFQRNALRTIQDNGRYLLTLLNDILDISKIEAGGLEIDWQDCPLHDLIQHVYSLLSPRAKEKEIELTLTISEDVPLLVRSDWTRLRQILINLLGNAIKFTSRGFVRVTIGYEQGWLTAEVFDTGIGISEEQLGRLFQPFSQADASTIRRFGGTGLGLYIASRLAEMMRGSIDVESEEEVGSKFTLRLPAPIIQESKQRTAPEPTPRDVRPLDCRILLAEDGPDNQRLIEAILQNRGAKVTTVEDGEAAFQAVITAYRYGEPFDVILMDLQMPVLDGYAAIAKLRAVDYPGPIIALTANAMKEERGRYLDLGCDFFLEKPIDRTALFTTIQAALLRRNTMECATV
ncbi:MAG: ATP-binding protein [Pirellulaceae bacterium]